MATRKDAIGLFWEDLPPVKKAKKEKVVRTPPYRFWEEDGYAPNAAEAMVWQPDYFNDMELMAAWKNKEPLIFDVESYKNYSLFAFKSVVSGKCLSFELLDDTLDPHGFNDFDTRKFKWVLEHFTIITFNGKHYDIPMAQLALAGYMPIHLWDATQQIIAFQIRPYEVLKMYEPVEFECDHIDLKNLVGVGVSLKAAGARLHCRKLQDLPIAFDKELTMEQWAIVKMYCFNDLDVTGLLYLDLQPQIAIRESQGGRYKLDLRSHSDAQMAEAIIASQIKKITGKHRINRTILPPGTKYKFKPQKFIRFKTKFLNSVLEIVKNSEFIVDDFSGELKMPASIAKLAITIGKGTYQMGMGGLHSQEKTVAHYTDDEYQIIDTDATSYYPRLILNAGITPDNLGGDFLIVYDGIVVERISAKKMGKAEIAECLKIVVNGTFGKLGSKWSIMYAPNLMIQVTLGGQLSMLMLVERCELANIEVISVNTDGIIVKVKKDRIDEFNKIVKMWEYDTGFQTEETRYKAVYSRDINNYIAVYETPQKGEIFKTKGVYAKTSSKKNAVTEICVIAVKELLAKGTPYEETIRNCKDIRQFTTMRQVPGGAVKGDQYLGKVVRWYYGLNSPGEIIKAKTGHAVSLSEGAQPCMTIPDEFPQDVNYDWYIAETKKILEKIGHTPVSSAEEEEEALEE